MVEKKCPICNRVFLSRGNGGKYCSDPCRREGKLEIYRATMKKKRAEKEAPRRRKPTFSIDDVVAYTNEVYRRTGELISYGEAVRRLEA